MLPLGGCTAHAIHARAPEALAEKIHCVCVGENTHQPPRTLGAAEVRHEHTHHVCGPADRTHWPAQRSRFVSSRAVWNHLPPPLGRVSRGGLQEVRRASHRRSLCKHIGRPCRTRSPSIPTPRTSNALLQSFSHGSAHGSCRTSACQNQLLQPDARGQLHAAACPGELISVRDAADEGGRYAAYPAQALRMKAVQTASRSNG